MLTDGSWSYPFYEQITQLDARNVDVFDGAFAWSAESFDLAHGADVMLPFAAEPLIRGKESWLALVLIAVSVLAVWLPAHRAARLDPITALREE